ncbi:hypothetical protein SAY87_007284 [Trapa incisa]|uniref:Uncharacterized protein n=1 Tax=Trapa incisa TaxID=236973 RepID=A0AAN7PZZ8_9MYRT|nr:hypothetical protein SAY87_007284 [Trapa incisa]
MKLLLHVTEELDNMAMELLMIRFDGLGSEGFSASEDPNVSLYATQLAQIQEMGFYGTVENIKVLSHFRNRSCSNRATPGESLARSGRVPHVSFPASSIIH